ncbi:MAG TPA: ribosome-associated translation inhibitor RaiA [Dehalococcoidia bacterium]|nr:ribosome-associated translation inhibitor RaiA [Dehalococcoidia bacterium]
MELMIKGKNLDVEEEAEKYIRNKFKKLERRLPDIQDAQVELSRENTKAVENRYVVQVTITSRGTLLRGEERAPNLFAAVDSVVDVLNRQIERFKGKLYHSKKRIKPSIKQLAAEQAASEAEEKAEEKKGIVKVKRFPVKPMSPEEAVEQMELLSHDFFLFYNAENDHFSLLYRRGDGNYGLIEPELA